MTMTDMKNNEAIDFGCEYLNRHAELSNNDEAKVGTNEYQGHAYFWGQEYKFTLRGDWLGMGGIDIVHPDGRRYGTQDFANENGEYDEANPIANRNYEKRSTTSA